MSLAPKLTALKELDLHLQYSTVRFNITDQMLSLCNLQHLGIDHTRQSPETILALQASLHLMPVLQHVRLNPRCLKADYRVLGLVKLSSLQNLHLSHCYMLDDVTAFNLMISMHNMGAKRPDVVCYLGGTAEVTLSMVEHITT